jgi:transitional endoplasmic reticulum ATPase
MTTMDLPNLHLAVSTLAKASGAQVELVGYASAMSTFQNSLRELLAGDNSFNRVSVGSVQYRSVEIGVGSTMQCVENGLHLIRSGNCKYVAHVRTDIMRGTLELEVMAFTAEDAAAFMQSAVDEIAKNNVYRGKVLSLEADEAEGGRCSTPTLRFHAFAKVEKEDIILPQATLDILERNTVGFFENSEVLRKANRSLKRGILLHGKPGTGKTFTARWLAQSREGMTVILMSGEQLWMIKQCCQIARMLAPSIVIMEDVDLVATQRDEGRHPMYQVTLHQLLNEMDGLSGEVPVLFLLTTNRPEAIEPAIASRPGRVDQAIEYPLPDAECRGRLIELYGRGLPLALTDVESIVARTEGASPAFIQEMMRKSVLIAAETSVGEGVPTITDEHCQAAIRELLFGGGELTRNLLGFAEAP